MLHIKKSIVRVAPFLAAALAFQAGCSSTARTGSSVAVVTKEAQEAMTPKMVLADLKAGNKRFASGNSNNYDLLGQARVTASGQYPKAIVLGCLDSRVPPEMVFDQGIGDI